MIINQIFIDFYNFTNYFQSICVRIYLNHFVRLLKINESFIPISTRKV